VPTKLPKLTCIELKSENEIEKISKIEDDPEF
jgi:hypothetical protein